MADAGIRFTLATRRTADAAMRLLIDVPSYADAALRVWVRGQRTADAGIRFMIRDAFIDDIQGSWGTNTRLQGDALAPVRIRGGGQKAGRIGGRWEPDV
jgi:hypothetical protein